MSYYAFRNLIEALLDKYDVNDPDYQALEEMDAREEIIDLFVGCYSAEDFLAYLEKTECDILQDLRYCDYETYEEIIEDIMECGKSNATYDTDKEEFMELETKEEQIEYKKDHADGLVTTSKGIIVSW